MHLDTFTTLIGLSTVVSVLGLQLLFFWSRDRQSPWLAWFGCTFLLGAAAALSYLLPRYGHEFLVLGVGNALRVAAFAFLWNGTRLFGGRQPEKLAVVFCLLVWLALCSVPQFLASEPLRIIGVSAFTALFCTLSAAELWRGRAEHLPSRMPSVAIFVSFALLVAVRIPLVNVTPFPFGALPLDPSWLAGFSLVVFLHAAFLAALMLQMTRERRELEQRHFALSDPLTGLFNRRAFHDQVAQPAKRRKGHSEVLALLVLDLDHFKSINDRFGHDAGDQVLQRFGVVARSATRKIDGLYRMGGEEFCFLLPGAGIDEARSAAERIRRRFEAQVIEVQAEKIRATVSIGVAVTEHSGFDLEGLLAAADNALYEAKARGRNICVLADDRSLRRPVVTGLANAAA
jgi:diguanylate cyclase (GGDEF)-like protein